MFRPIPLTTAQQVLPPEFTPTQQPGGQVLAIFGGLTCTGDGAHRAFVAIFAFPKNESWQEANLADEVYEPEQDVQVGDAFAAALAQLNISFSTATVSLSAMAPMAQLAARGAQLSQSLTVTGGAEAAEPGADFGNVREWFAAAGGFAYFRYHQSGNVASGIGTLTATPGTPAAAVFGESTRGPTFIAIGHALTDASVVFVPFAGN
jgi:hypothetical protein